MHETITGKIDLQTLNAPFSSSNYGINHMRIYISQEISSIKCILLTQNESDVHLQLYRTKIMYIKAAKVLIFDDNVGPSLYYAVNVHVTLSERASWMMSVHVYCFR